MGLRINTNLASLRAVRDTQVSYKGLTDVYAKLSSGERITKSADDAAGLAISENLKGQIRGFGQISRNAQDAVSLVQVAEGGLTEIGNNLIRLRELAIQGASDNIGDRERSYLNLEFSQLLSEMQRVSETTRFGSVNLLDGSGAEMDFQVGLNNVAEQDRISFDSSLVNAQLSSLGVGGTSVETKEASRDGLASIDEAINKVAGFRAEFGSINSRLNTTTAVTEIAKETLSAANSRIRDADIGIESAKLASETVRQQASTAILAQANNSTAAALRLIN